MDATDAKEDDTRRAIEEQLDVEAADAQARGQQVDRKKLRKELQRVAELQDRKARR